MVEIREDGSTQLSGIVLYYPKDSFTTGYTFAPQNQPAILGDKVGFGMGKGRVIGLPAQPNLGNMPATVLFKATSAGASSTTIDVTEYD